MFNKRLGILDNPLEFALSLVLNGNYSTGNQLNNLINNSDISDCQQYLQGEMFIIV